MDKYTFIDNRLVYSRYCHADDIEAKNYDTAIRLIIFDKKKIIYIRINDFTYSYGLERKQLEYKFKQNLRTCKAYLKSKYRKYNIYDSFTIGKLPSRLQRDVLST